MIIGQNDLKLNISASFCCLILKMSNKKLFLMKKIFISTLLLLGVYSATPAFAQDATAESSSNNALSVNAGADLVSTYVWRGMNLAPASFQPSLGFSVAGFSLGAWGSADFEHGVNEFDLAAAYNISCVTFGLTDYCGAYTRLEDGTFPKYGDYDNHILEANAALDFGAISDKFKLTIAANVNLVNDKDDNDDEQYSTYIEFGYPVTVGDVDVAFALGLTPAEGLYSDGFNVTNISIKGSRTVKITPDFSIPVFAQAVLNPYTEQTYMIFGITF